MFKRICIYCASSTKIDPLYFEAAEVISKKLVEQDVTIVFGGGGRGLMGCVADTVIRQGGRIVGIIPHFMKELEWAHEHVKEMTFVDTMHQRKNQLLSDTDAVIALPGGTGTLEELLEVITLKKLGIYNQPIIIANINGYYDPLIEMLDRSIEQHFMHPNHKSLWTVLENAEDVIEVLKAAPKWDASARNFAAV